MPRGRSAQRSARPPPRRSPGRPSGSARAASPHGRRTPPRAPARSSSSSFAPVLDRPEVGVELAERDGTSSTCRTTIVATPLGREPRSRDQRLLRSPGERLTGTRIVRYSASAMGRSRWPALGPSRAAARRSDADRRCRRRTRPPASRAPRTACPASGRRPRSRRSPCRPCRAVRTAASRRRASEGWAARGTGARARLRRAGSTTIASVRDRERQRRAERVHRAR